jgi:PilZ domain
MGSNDAKTRESQRKQMRYAVSEDCRLRASIRIRSSDPASADKDWPGTLVDLSAGGAHIQISIGAVAYIRDSCVVKLAHGAAKTEMRGTLAHYVCSSRHSVCGVMFDSFAAGWDKAYQPFFKAIVASATLKGGPTDSVSPRRYREEYSGPGYTKLVVWRDNKPERALVGFDYMMARYGAVLAAPGTDMVKNKAEVRFKAAPTESGLPGAPLSPAQEAEASWEFSLAASNLPPTIAPDIRRFLRLVS